MRTFASSIVRVTRELYKRSGYKIRQNYRPSSFTFLTERARKSYGTATGKMREAAPAAACFGVEVTSRDMIKPSSPTPPHLKSHRFSILDQITNSFFIPVIIFYQNDPNHHLASDPVKRTTLLRKSLSDTLVDFYPLAGRIDGLVSMNCNDEGAEFCEAQVSETLMSVIGNPNLEELQALLPFQVTPRHKNIVLSVQVNHFSCGGMAISICLSHKIADFASTTYFLQAWADKASGNNDMARPKFDAASILPPLTDLNGMFTGDSIKRCEESIATKRLIFDKMKLDELKARADACSDATIRNLNPRPTKVELVSAFIWNKLVEAAATKPGFSKISTALHSVNLRPRLEPALPESCFGNLAWLARTPPMSITEGTQQQIIQNREMIMINHLRKSFNKLDYNYVRPLFCRDRNVSELRREVDYLVDVRDKCVNFSSLGRYSLYEVNFGMGEPVWGCVTTSSIKDVVMLFETKCGKGIEAWFHMRDSDIAML